MWNLETVRAALASVRGPPSKGRVRWDPAADVFIDASLHRGFPLGGIGTGGFGVGTDGGFVDLRVNHNWMAPLPHLKGSFFALKTGVGVGAETRILRRCFSGGAEYPNVRGVAHTRFRGRPPTFELQFLDDALAVDTDLTGFSALVPHDEEASSLPVAFFLVSLRNPRAQAMPFELMLSWENTLGRGGTGQTGLDVGPNGRPRNVLGRALYDDVSKNHQRRVIIDEREGLLFETRLAPDPASHRRSTVGSYLLLADLPAPSSVYGSSDLGRRGLERGDLDVLTIEQWDAADRAPSVLETFRPPARATGVKRPAGALVVRGDVQGRDRVDVPFLLAWWMPDHVVETDPVGAQRRGRHDGVRVGPAYAARYASVEALAAAASKRRAELLDRSERLITFVGGSTLPPWLQTAVLRSSAPVQTNTVLADGPAAADGGRGPSASSMPSGSSGSSGPSAELYTLEGAGWGWPFGGLCGTNDQRLSASAFTQSFFPRLDKSELEVFRRLARGGSVPHGIGNCDLALGTDDVPYGRPLHVKGVLDAADWPDLTLSWILQAARLSRTTGDEAWIDEAWPDLVAMFEHLLELSIDDVPHGGTTFDTFRFEGLVTYTATLALAAYDVLAGWAAEREPVLLKRIREARARCADRIQLALWDKRGFFKSCSGRDTLFFGSLAGVWAAARIGLEPILDPGQVKSHLAHQHRVLVERPAPPQRRAPFVTSEATFEGKPVSHRVFGVVRVFPYVWQLLSYHAQSCLTVGLVEEGLSALRTLFDWMTVRGAAFSPDLFGNAGPIYMTHPVCWATLDTLAGAAFDATTRTLCLNPQRPTSSPVHLLPVVFPGFWAYVGVDVGQREVWLKVVWNQASPQQVEELVLGPERARVRLDEPWVLEAGRTYRVPLGAAPTPAR